MYEAAVPIEQLELLFFHEPDGLHSIALEAASAVESSSDEQRFVKLGRRIGTERREALAKMMAYDVRDLAGVRHGANSASRANQ